jgi:aarF domain-containing kinase
MAGKRILDAAALFNASRSIAAKHVNLRTHQFEVYSKTSSLATTVRNQTERVTLTASAAVSLARRLNESGPAYSTTASGTQASEKKGRESSVPSRESVEGNRGSSATRDGFEDHFYNRSEDNSAVDPVPDHDLGVRQEQPKRYPLADGTIPPDTAEDGVRRAHEDVYNTRPTAEPVKQPLEHERGGIQPNSSARSSIPTPFASSKTLEPEEAKRLQRQAEFQIPAKSAEPPPASAKDLNAPVDEYGEELGVDQEQDVFYRPSPNAPPVLSALPRVKIPRTTINLQEGDEHLPEDRTNPDVFYHSDGTLSKKGLPSAQAVPEQDDPTEDIMKDLFHSPKVASLLSSKRRGRSGDGDFKLTGAGKTPIDQTGLNKGKDQDTFNVRVSSQTSPEKPDQVLDGVDGGSSEGAYEDIQKLAANVAKEATGQKPDVRIPDSSTHDIQTMNADRLTEAV